MSTYAMPSRPSDAGPLDGHAPDFGELCDEAIAALYVAGRAETRPARRELVGHVMELMQRALDADLS